MADYKLNKQIRAQCNAFRQVSKPQSLDADTGDPDGVML
jgi:hypothetical protein